MVDVALRGPPIVCAKSEKYPLLLFQPGGNPMLRFATPSLVHLAMPFSLVRSTRRGQASQLARLIVRRSALACGKGLRAPRIILSCLYAGPEGIRIGEANRQGMGWGEGGQV